MTLRPNTTTAALLRTALRTTTILTIAIGAQAQAQEALPSGSAIAAGSASVSASGTVLRIDQSTSRAVINWSGFSVGQGSTVEFRQPDAQSATLNRVLGTTASTIAGQVNANGAVYLVNPNGIAITSSGTVDTGGGFVATTLDIADGDFMAGKASFTGKGASARVSNAGRITAGQGGYVALLGGSAANSGTITVPLGKLALGSGEQIALDINGSNFLQVAVPSSVVTGSAALIDNSGTITVAGGAVSLKAAVLKDAVRNVINMSGSISADSAVGSGGTIHLIGGADTNSMAGQVTVSGSLSARATGADGDGGFIETSGQHIDLNGVQVSTAAASGKAGTWLIDPTDFTIAASGGDITGAALSSNLAGGSITILSSNGASGSDGDVTVNDAVSWSSGNSLTLSAERNVAVNAGITATGAGAGLVLRADNTGTGTGTVLFGGGATANLSGTNSFADIYYNPAVFGSPTAFAEVTSGETTAYQLVNNLTNLQAIGSYLSGNFALGRDIDASATSGWNSGAGFEPIGNYTLSSPGPFSGSFDGQDFTISGLTINRAGTAVGLFGITSNTAKIRRVVLRGVSVTGRATTTVGPIGGLVGLNNGTISHSHSAGTMSSDSTAGGLVGDNRGAISHSSANVISVDNGGVVGGLVGANEGTIRFSHASGAITNSFGATGGLVGINREGAVSDSYATGAVVLSSAPPYLIGAGGLVGSNNGSILRSFATGSVDAPGSAGGLVGFNYLGVIGQSYATGQVSGTDAIGGLVGWNRAEVTESYATGPVAGVTRVGGLVGKAEFSSDISSSYWDSYSTGQSAGVGEAGSTLVSNVLAVTSDPAQSGAANYAFSAGGYGNFQAGGESDVDSIGGQNLTWRIYAGYTYPLLKAFLTRADYTTTAQSTFVYDGTLKSLSGWSFAAGVDMARIFGTAPSSISGTNAGTYRLSGLYSNQLGYDIVATPLTITPRPVTITYFAGSGTVVYGDPIPDPRTFGWGTSVTGGFAGQDLTGIAIFTTTATSQSGVGNYAITGSGLSLTSNYDVTVIQAPNNATALTIEPRAITITADALTRYYGDANPALTYTVGGKGLVNDDTLSGALTTAATVTSNVGDYAITQGTLAASDNYAITYVGANLSVTPRPLTVTYTANPASRSFGDPNPALSGSVSSSGLVNDDELGGTAVWTTPATPGSGVGRYAINGSGIAASGNYELTSVQAPGNATALTITPRAVTVVYTANPVSRSYGNANPLLAGSYTVQGLVGGDALGGSLRWTTTAGGSTGVGSYAITGSGLFAGGNYALSSVQAQSNATALTITPRAIAVNAYAKVRNYGDANPVLNYWISGAGLVNGDRLSGALATSATTASNVGTYAITQGTLAASANYSVTYNGANLTILPRPLTVTYTASAASRTYGDANPALTGSVISVGLVNGDSLGGAPVWSTPATATSAVGAYRITGSGLSASGNYRLTTVQAAGNATALTINPRAITITADALTRYYGSPNPAFSYTIGGQGLVNGDKLVGSLATSATIPSAPGDYAIVRGSLWASPNYAVTYTGANLTIVPR
ncbi:MBG domain-containing protein [Novosphingobium sp.]|uniref:beta strand repeat-containing protein n=1 Tax=Novosphingobium sp. TaxID=1874826 RepID=UPI001EC5C0C3|nr:MBG domain-containing protein [Novosphingobium sp.]MBK9011443.1 filamentous hemagglutinin N-terminal domain-containing protein [Novosphingobium sp.]